MDPPITHRLQNETVWLDRPHSRLFRLSLNRSHSRDNYRAHSKYYILCNKMSVEVEMTGNQLREARKLKGWNQQQAARRLGVSQTYLSLMEKGRRRVPEKFAVKAVRVYGLSAALLPVSSSQDHSPAADGGKLAMELAALGYPGLSYLKSGGRKKIFCSCFPKCLWQDEPCHADPYLAGLESGNSWR